MTTDLSRRFSAYRASRTRPAPEPAHYPSAYSCNCAGTGCHPGMPPAVGLPGPWGIHADEITAESAHEAALEYMTLDDPSYRAFCVLLASLRHGPDPLVISACLGVSRFGVEAIGRRLRACGVWGDGCVVGEGWEDPSGGDISFVLDAMCGSGELHRVGDRYFRGPLPAAKAPRGLTEREALAVRLRADGLNRGQAAARMGSTAMAVSMLWHSAKRKLGASGWAEALAPTADSSMAT